MTFISTVNHYLAKGCQALSILLLLTIMMVTLANVTTRALFSLTAGAWSWYVQGSIELVTYGLMLALLSGFAGYVERAQIIIDIFSQYYSNYWQTIISAFTLLLYAILGFIFTQGFIDNTVNAKQFGEVTQDLRLPLSYIYLAASSLSAIFTLRALFCSLEQLFGTINNRSAQLD